MKYYEKYYMRLFTAYVVLACQKIYYENYHQMDLKYFTQII